MKLITSSMLKGACREQRALFKATFPDGAPVTVAAARKARKAELDVQWLDRLMPYPLYKQYQDARASLDKQYQDARASLDKQYWDARAPLGKQYWDARASLEKQYWDARASLEKQYWDALAPLDKQYEDARDKLLVSYLRRVEGGKG